MRYPDLRVLLSTPVVYGCIQVVQSDGAQHILYRYPDLRVLLSTPVVYGCIQVVQSDGAQHILYSHACLELTQTCDHASFKSMSLSMKSAPPLGQRP